MALKDELAVIDGALYAGFEPSRDIDNMTIEALYYEAVNYLSINI